MTASSCPSAPILGALIATSMIEPSDDVIEPVMSQIKLKSTLTQSYQFESDESCQFYIKNGPLELNFIYLCRHNQNFQRLTIYLSGFDSNQLYFPSALHLQTVHCTFPLTLENEIKSVFLLQRLQFIHFGRKTHMHIE